MIAAHALALVVLGFTVAIGLVIGPPLLWQPLAVCVPCALVGLAAGALMVERGIELWSWA